MQRADMVAPGQRQNNNKKLSKAQRRVKLFQGQRTVSNPRQVFLQERPVRVKIVSDPDRDL